MVDCPAVGKGSGYPLYNPLPTEQGPFPFCQRTIPGECAGDVIEKMAEMDQGPALVRGGDIAEKLAPSLLLPSIPAGEYARGKRGMVEYGNG